MSRPLAADDTAAGKMAREIIEDALADAEPIGPAVKRTIRDLLEWQTRELERLTAGSERIIEVLAHGRGAAAGYEGARALTPDEARELVKRLLVCADHVDASVARDKGKR